METPTPNRALDDIWQAVRDRLRADVGDAAYNSWLKQLELTNIHDDRVLMSVPTRFMRDWVVSHYAEKIRTAWSDESGAEPQIDILVRPSGQAAPVLKSAPGAPVQDKPIDQGLAEAGAPLDPSCTFDNFVVGKANELAYAAARRVAESDVVPFNPLYLYGGVGLGKTHLMHAIAAHIRDRFPERKVLYLSAEKFMYQFIRALRIKNVMAFKQQFRSVDVLMIDYVQFIAGKNTTQKNFSTPLMPWWTKTARSLFRAIAPPVILMASRSACAHAWAGVLWPISMQPITNFASASCKARQNRPVQQMCRSGSWNSSPTVSPPTCESWKAP